jgi:endonuclease I
MTAPRKIYMVQNRSGYIYCANTDETDQRGQIGFLDWNAAERYRVECGMNLEIIEFLEMPRDSAD